MCGKSRELTNEDEEKFQAMRDGYMQHFQPEGEVELDLVEEVISARWRIWTIETALLDLKMDTQMKEIEDQFKHIDETTRTAIAYKSLADTSKSLTQTTRHEALFSRQYRLAMKTLIQIHKEPAAEIIPITRIDRVEARPSPDPEIVESTPAPLSELPDSHDFT